MRAGDDKGAVIVSVVLFVTCSEGQRPASGEENVGFAVYRFGRSVAVSGEIGGCAKTKAADVIG